MVENCSKKTKFSSHKADKLIISEPNIVTKFQYIRFVFKNNNFSYRIRMCKTVRLEYRRENNITKKCRRFNNNKIII